MTSAGKHIYTVELRIESLDLDPEKITKEIGIRPSHFRHPTERGDGARKRNGVWAYCGVDASEFGKKDWQSLEEGLNALIDELNPLLSRLKMQMSQHRVFWWCGNFQTSFDGGPELSVAVLRRLADFGVPLLMDNYFSAE